MAQIEAAQLLVPGGGVKGRETEKAEQTRVEEVQSNEGRGLFP